MNLTEEQMRSTCGNCSRKIYKSGGKWYHQSSGGMACSAGITALATPNASDAATLMGDKCVSVVKEYFQYFPCTCSGKRDSKEHFAVCPIMIRAALIERVEAVMLDDDSEIHTTRTLQN